MPPQILAQYQAVNDRATQTANTPFQEFGGQFVAPVNNQQSAGITGTNTAANEAQPYFDAATGQLTQAQNNTTGVNNAATGLAAASAGAVNPSALDASSINRYLSPYLNDVLGSTSKLIDQNNATAQTGALGTAIQSGAFGGDRTGIAAANLEQQQDLAEGNVYSNIANTGFQSALSTAQQQQGVGLGAAQANRAALANAGSELAGIGSTAYGEGSNTATTLAGLGSGAQTAGLQGANAQIAAGTVEQQTQQAQDAALYNQFLQQQSYPFQVDQFLANIAEGTGALSGSTTTTQQPGGFFSDRRLKHSIRKIGETFDHQPIYAYKMHGDDRTHVGLIAQNVEKKHPNAVGLAAGYKIVDYGRATEDAANRGHFYAGGVVPRAAYAMGGGPSIVSAGDLASILAAQEQMYAPMSGSAGVYGGSGGSVPRGGSSRVPPPSGATPHLVTAEGGLRPVPTGMQNAKNLTDMSDSALKLWRDAHRDRAPPKAPVAPSTTTTETTPGGLSSANMDAANDDAPQYACSGGVVDRRGYDSGGSTDDDGIDAVLAAQQRMYQPQERSREIPNEGGSHQLAVASGSPTPPPSGSSNVNQALGLGQKGYQIYHHFNTPTTSTGVSPGAAATEGPATDSAAAGAAQAGAASEAAAPAAGGAAEGAAAGAGADAAGAAAGSAAGAAGGAAVDAGATEAAALAAEYAAADAAVALAAAKRGGRIKRAAGGINPYDADGTDLAIPDEENAAHLQTAGPIKKQPTGLQTAMTLGDPNQASTIAGSMFSNEALKRGGVAGRRGYDDGGDVDPDAQDVPQGGVAAPASAAPKDHWYKHAENVIPLLTGLAAMGTAPTRSLGVALSSGLGAGAQSYLNTRGSLADTAQTQTRTQGLDLANQIAQQKLNYLKGAPAAPASAPVSPLPSQSSYAPVDLRKQYYVPPVLPEESTRLQYAYKQAVALGSNEPVEAAKAAIQNRVQSQVAANRNDAQQNYDDAYSVANSAKDPELKASAAAVADAYHQWTGDENAVKDGVLLNTRTGKPPIGDQAQRLSTQKYADLMNEAMTKSAVPTGVPGETKLMPKWQISGASSPQAYVSSLPPAGTPGLPASAAPAPRASAAAPRRPASAATAVTAPSPAVPVSPVDAKAYTDAKYKLAPIPTQIGTTPATSVANQVEATSKSRQELQQDAETTAQSSAAALQFAQAAKQIMDSKGGAPITGFWGPVAKTISSVFGGVNATNYQEVAKYLGNLGVQTGKGNFPHATEKENMIQFNQLSPSTAQTEDALNGLLDSNIRTSQYTLDTANRTTKYLDSKGYNGDPQKFFRWNQEHYPRADNVNPPNTVPTVKTKADYDALPKGAAYVHNGKPGVKQ